MKTDEMKFQKELAASNGTRKARRGIFLGSALAIATGCLCCITPLVLVLFGLASISTAASVDSMLSGKYIWVFRSVGLLFLAVALVMYFRRRGICTLDAARRQRNRIINTVVLTLLLAIGGYIAFEYIALSYWGEVVGLPWAVERWAYLWAGILLAAGGLFYALVFRRTSKDTSSSAGDSAAKGESEA